MVSLVFLSHYLPIGVSLIAALVVVGKYVAPEYFARLSYLMIGKFLAWFTVLFALLETLAQYLVWAHDPFLRIFLSLPLDKAVPFPEWMLGMRPLFEGNFGYFAYYVLGRFWLHAFLLILGASFCYGVYALFGRYKPGAFTRNELLLVFIGGMVSGWPGVLVFFPLSLILLFVLECARMFFAKPVFSTASVFLFAMLVMMVFKYQLIVLLHLGVFSV